MEHGICGGARPFSEQRKNAFSFSEQRGSAFSDERKNADNINSITGSENYSRTVLHCDANSFFASCESAVKPEYRKVPMAVCGSTDDRHGIVLAKNELAKKYRIKTGETVWQAKQKCPSLVTVRPTYGLYEDFSCRLNAIFRDYTDMVEPFGIDESWLDVTGSRRLFGSGKEIADTIRDRVRKELKITVSVGVSFNKVFAKLGSDMKKPDATTVIPYEHFASEIWNNPVNDLLFVGPACYEKLKKAGIMTIGDLAATDEKFIKRYLGKTGIMLREFAQGRDFSPVMPDSYERDPKSVSNGMTFRFNLKTDEDISFAVTYLSHKVAYRLRKYNKVCRTVGITVRFPDQTSFCRRMKADRETALACDIARCAFSLVKTSVCEGQEIYALTVHAESLKNDMNIGMQEKMFPTESDIDYGKHISLENAMDGIKDRFGMNSLTFASALNNRLI